MSTVPVSEAIANLPRLLDALQAGAEPVCIVCHSQPCAVLLNIEDYEALTTVTRLVGDADFRRAWEWSPKFP